MKNLFNIQFFAADGKITREEAIALIQEKYAPEVISSTPEASLVLSHCKRLPNMTSGTFNMPVADSLPVAGFVNGDGGLKPTTDAEWKNVKIYAEEIACIIPISENTLADSAYDIWGQLKPQIMAAIGKTIDAAMLYGTGKPDNWPAGLVTQIKAAGTNVTNTGNLYNDIDSAMEYVEANGYEASAIVGGIQLKSGFRKMRDTLGQPITGTEIDSLPRSFLKNGAWNNKEAIAIVGDFDNIVYSIRQDVQFKLLTEGVLTDSNGKVIVNFGQQDMVGLRVCMRLGWAMPNPVNALNPTATRIPFASIDAAALAA